MKITKLGFAGVVFSGLVFITCPLIAGAQSTGGAAVTPEQQRSIDARNAQKNATIVTAGSSVFRYVPSGRWIEQVNGVDTRNYYEDGRQEYMTRLGLIERETHNRVELDFLAREVNYNHGALRVPFAATSNEVTGANVTAVRFATGTLKMKTRSTKEWVERSSGPNPKTFNFVEVGRGDGGVGLLDATRNVQLEIRLSDNSIMYSSARQPAQRKLYSITGASAVQYYSVATID